jgi:putative radical SAM enzyme (TIGR03279 family)
MLSSLPEAGKITRLLLSNFEIAIDNKNSGGKMSAVITGVEPGSLAAKKQIRAGDTLLKINGHEIEDVLDYRFYIAEKSVEALFSTGGKTKTVKFKKQEYEDLGLDFETYLMDEKRNCRNNCIFCFIDQLPKNMRETLYFKDDDARLSFLMGNYITLTNLKERDVERIIEMHISPVNISVHTTNPDLRVKMMRNKNAGKALDIIPRLAAAGIKINCQLVLCPGINDGAELERSLRELSALYPSVENIAAVPIGLTDHREGLFELNPYSEKEALSVVRIIENFEEAFFKKNGTRLAFAADEFYLKAGLQIHDAEFYEDMDQLENGVGLIALLQSEFNSALKLNEVEKLDVPRKISIATGVAAKPFIDKLALSAQNSIAGLDCRVYSIINDFFGQLINVAGLVTGNDLISQLEGKELGEELLIPSVMLRSEGDVFLDDVSVADVEKRLKIKVKPVANDGFELLSAMTGLEV